MVRRFCLVVVGFAAVSVARAEEPTTVRDAVAAYAAAFNKGDVDALVATWSTDAEYIDETGRSFQGRDAIAELLRKQVAALKGHKLALTVTALRPLPGGMVMEDGTAEMTAPDGVAGQSRYTALWVKGGNGWRLRHVRDLPGGTANGDAPAYARLKELEWLVGNWTGTGAAAKVSLTSRWALNKSFLVIDFTVNAGDGEALIVSQWVGRDPSNGGIRSWHFDSHGGFGDGAWTRKGNAWTADSFGVLPDGRQGSSKITIKFVDGKSFIWQSVDREVDGVPIADTEIKFSRK